MKKIKIKARSVVGLSASFRGGAGAHRDHKFYDKNQVYRSNVVEDDSQPADTMNAEEMKRLIVSIMISDAEAEYSQEQAQVIVEGMSLIEMKDFINEYLY